MSPIFVVGAPRSGTHFAAELFRKTPHYSVWHSDDVDKAAGDSFLGYAKWHGLSVHAKSLVAFRQKLVAGSPSGNVYVESNCYLSLFARELHEAFEARFVFLVREPADVVNSLFVRGWYEDPLCAPPSFDYNVDRPNHAFGRLTPSVPEEFERFQDLTRIGKISWFYNALNTRVLEDLRALPRQRWSLLGVDRLDHVAFAGLLTRLGSAQPISERDFHAVVLHRPGQASRHRTRDDWTARETAEFERECRVVFGLFEELRGH